MPHIPDPGQVQIMSFGSTDGGWVHSGTDGGTMLTDGGHAYQDGGWITQSV